MAKRTLAGFAAHIVNTGLAAAGMTISKIPERNTLERKITELLQAYKVDCVIDVGGHFGEFAESLRHLGYKGRIISFEPSEDAFNRIKLKADQDDLWEVHRSCVGNNDGTVELKQFQYTTFNSLHAPTNFAQVGWFSEHMQPVGVEHVPIRKLDTLLPEIGVDTSLHNVYLKIDTQGHDLEVMRGAAGILNGINILQTELSALALYEETPSMSESLAYFMQVGFLPDGFYAVPNPKNPTPVLEWDCVLRRVNQEILSPHEGLSSNSA